MDNTCVFCGEIIPEGRQVCPQCEEKYGELETRYWAQNMLIARTEDAEAKLRRDIEWLMKNPLQGCKLCAKRDAECANSGADCAPVYNGREETESAD